MLELPTLYARARNGAITQWRVYNRGDIVCTEFGKLGGKQTLHQDRVRSTNVGRANARIGEAQAEAEAQSAWTKKLAEGYFDSVNKAQTALVLLPMLAHPLEKKVKRSGKEMKVERDVNWNHVWVQPKLNGLRCLTMYYDPTLTVFADMAGKPPAADIVMRSREGEDWTTLKHIKEDLAMLMRPGDMVDGEVYQHHVPLQQLNSYIKREQEQTKFLQYHLYDFPAQRGVITAGWDSRWSCLRDAYATYVHYKTALAKVSMFSRHFIEETIDGLHPGGRLALIISMLPIQLVPTVTATSRSEARALQQKFIQDGYEGAILRASERPYEFNNRCDGLLKLKDFQDESFVILDVKGRELIKDDKSVTIVDKFVFQNNLPGDTTAFEAVPRGTMEERAAWWNQRKELVGETMTVRFLERSVSKLPQGNPVALGFRLEEDLGPEEGSLWT